MKDGEKLLTFREILDLPLSSSNSGDGNGGDETTRSYPSKGGPKGPEGEAAVDRALLTNDNGPCGVCSRIFHKSDGGGSDLHFREDHGSGGRNGPCYRQFRSGGRYLMCGCSGFQSLDSLGRKVVTGG